MNLIICKSKNNVIGIQNKIPWKCKEDLRFFKENTIGNVVVMGANTFKSLKKPLVGRLNIVISNTLKEQKTKDLIITNNINWLIEYLKNFENVFILGGKKIYEMFKPLCDTLYITTILKEFEGDTFAPYFDLTQYTLKDTKTIFSKELNCDVKFELFKRT